jgi:AcrR family transcriptional regulator
MAKSGAPSRVVERGGSRSEGTRRLLVEAAIETLKDVGFSGASARAIAERAEVNQALIFYHFDSVGNLLLAALDAVSDERMNAYREVVDEARSPRQLVEAAKTIFAKDLDAGYITVLVEMIAGASSTPGLGDQVLSRIGPWREFAQTAVEGIIGESPLGSVVPPQDLAYGIVALYLGLEMLSHLGGDRKPALDLFAHAERLANLFEGMTVSKPKE